MEAIYVSVNKAMPWQVQQILVENERLYRQAKRSGASSLVLAEYRSLSSDLLELLRVRSDATKRDLVESFSIA